MRPDFSAAKCILLATGVLLCATFFSCSKNKKNSKSLADTLSLEEISSDAKNHRWFSFTKTSFVETALPQRSMAVEPHPWTEAVRISSMAAVPAGSGAVSVPAFALVNKIGVLTLTQENARLYEDASVFASDTCDSIVFNGSTPVFYLYRSTFFNERLTEQKIGVQPSRPFLIEFNPQSKICFPLVTYTNLGLTNDDQISGYFWDGKTWACAAKKMSGDKVEFTYFYWEPLVALTDISPALNASNFSFRTASEREYTSLTMPRLYSSAPVQMRSLLESIPKEFTFYISWRDLSGTSPVSYYQNGNGAVPLNAHGAQFPLSKMTCAVFADGTTYVRDDENGKITAFRLPLLPAGFVYGEFALAGKTMYVAWEETFFYKTGRSGFIQVDLSQILN